MLELEAFEVVEGEHNHAVAVADSLVLSHFVMGDACGVEGGDEVADGPVEAAADGDLGGERVAVFDQVGDG